MKIFQQFQQPGRFGRAVGEVEQYLREWFSGPRSRSPQLDRFAFPVYLKNRQRVLTLVNSSYQNFFCREELPVGKHSDSVLTASISKVSAESDAIILDGYSRIELDHPGIGPNNRRYLMRTHKVDLSGYKYKPYAILGISIPIRVLDDPQGHHPNVEESFLIYESFDPDDKHICTMYALGETTRSIAEYLGRSPKTVENHRHEILKRLGLSKPVEIIRLLVRFEERGLIDDFTKIVP